MKFMKYTICSIVFAACSAYGQGDTLQDICYHSMKYNVSVQLAGSAFSDQDANEYKEEAYDNGNWLGIEKAETDRMLVMAAGSPNTNQFAYRYLSDPSFANAYRNGFINDCKSKPSNYSLRRE